MGYVRALIIFVLVGMAVMYIQSPQYIHIQRDGHFTSTDQSHFLYEASASDTHPTTIVTAYYPLGNASKHTSAGYDAWMANFFPWVKAPILVFLPSGPIIERVKQMRGELPLTVKVRTVSSDLIIVTTNPTRVLFFNFQFN